MTDPDQDLISSLAAYGALVEAEAKERLRPRHLEVEFIDDSPPAVVSELVHHQPRIEPRRLYAAAACVLLVLGGLFAVQSSTGGSDSVLATASTPVDGPLFVLPQASSGATVSNGQFDQFGLQDGTSDTGPIVGGVIGKPDDGGYVDIVRVSIVSREAFLNEENLVRVADTSVYKAAEPRPGEALIEDRGEVAVWLSTLIGSIDNHEEIFAQVNVMADRTFDFGDGTEFVLIDSWLLDSAVTDRGSTSFDLAVDDGRFFVETAEVPVGSAFDVADRVEAIPLGSETAWLAERDDASYGIMWQATPTQSIFISSSEDGPAPANELVAAAQLLTIVERAEWFAAFPALEDSGPDTTTEADPEPPATATTGADDPASTPSGPAAPLYVLPESLDGFRSFGFDRSETPSGDTGSAIVVGRPRTGGFSDVSTIAFLQQPSFADSESETISVADRTVQVAAYDQFDPNPPIALAVEGGGWLQIQPARVELRELLIERTTITNGDLTFDPTEGIEELQRIDDLQVARTRFTSLRGAPESFDYVSIIVQSTPNTDLATLFPAHGEIDAVQIRGHDGFVVQNNGVWSPLTGALSWIEQPGQLIMIRVAGDVDPFEIAEGLRVVDETTWISEQEALEEAGFDENLMNQALGSFSMLNETGQPVEVVPDGSITVFIAAPQDCEACNSTLASVNSLLPNLDPKVRVIAVRLDPESTWGQPPTWNGDTWTLPNDADEDLRTPLETRGILVIDGSNITQISIPADSPKATDQLAFVLEALS